MIKIPKELENKLEEKFERLKESKDYEVYSYDGYRHRYDKESKRINKWLKKRERPPERKEQLRRKLLDEIKRNNSGVDYYNQTGKKYRINYSLATFVCDAYILVKIKTKYTRPQIIEYLSQDFLYKKKGIDRDPDVLNKALSRAGVTNKILPYIKELLISKKPA